MPAPLKSALMCENISLLLSIPLPPPPSLSHSLPLVALRIFLLRLRPTMRLSVSMLSPTNNEKNLRICFEARKIIKNNPFPFFSLPLFPLFCFEVRAELSSGCHCRLSGHRLAKLVDCFCSRFKQLRCVYAVCAWQFVCVCAHFNCSTGAICMHHNLLCKIMCQNCCGFFFIMP